MIYKTNKSKFKEFLKGVKTSGLLCNKSEFIDILFDNSFKEFYQYNTTRYIEPEMIHYQENYLLRIGKNFFDCVFIDIQDNDILEYSYCEFIPKEFLTELTKGIK